MTYVLLVLVGISATSLVIGIAQGVKHFPEESFNKSMPWLLVTMGLGAVVQIVGAIVS